SLFVALLLSAGGCVHEPRPVAYVPGPDGGTPRRGGHAVFVREEDPDYLDPGLSYGTYSAAVTEAIFHTLLDYAHEPGPAGATPLPGLAAPPPPRPDSGTPHSLPARPP